MCFIFWVDGWSLYSPNQDSAANSFAYGDIGVYWGVLFDNQRFLNKRVIEIKRLKLWATVVGAGVANGGGETSHIFLKTFTD